MPLLNVKIYDHNHEFRKREISIKDQGFNIKEVCIGSNVWCGSNVVILKGVNIGDTCVIAAGCVVHDSIPSNSIMKIDGK